MNLDSIFISILNLSLIAIYVVLLVLISRFLLKKSPKIFSYALWAVVLIRLICPFSFESILGLLPSNTHPIPQNIMYQQNPKIDTGIDIVDKTVNHILPTVVTPEASINPMQIWIFIGRNIWLLGIFVMLLYSIVSFVKLRRKLIGATPLEKNIFIADNIASPFVMGIINPKIYLPSNLENCERDFVIEHERTHIKRLDHITRILGFIALSLHWFNPFVWLAFVLSGKDMESSCDEIVMKKIDKDIRADYSQSLLKFATGKRLITSTPLAFGEGDTKNRVKNVMKYKKPTIWVSSIALVFVLIASVLFLSNQVGEVSIFEIDSFYLKENRFDEITDITIKKNAEFYEIKKADVDDIKDFIKSIKLNRVELSSSRGDSRDKFYQIELYNNEKVLYYTFNFNSDFSEIWLDNGIKPSFSYALETPMTEMLKFFTRYTETSNIELLFENRTKYVGDNSAVINICSNLPLPSDAKYDSIKINSDTMGLTVNLKGNVRKYHEQVESQGIFSQNAVLLFSLIENLEQITFDINPENEEYGGILFTRKNAEDTFGELFSQTESLEKLSELVNKIFLVKIEQDTIDILNLSDIPANFDGLKIDKIEVITSSEFEEFGAEMKVFTSSNDIKAFIEIFENAKINDEIAIDIAIENPSYYRFYQGNSLVKEYQFNGNDTTAIWSENEGYKLIEYIADTPFEIFEQSIASTIIYYENHNFAKAVDVSKKYVKDDDENKITNYLRPMVENISVKKDYKVYNTETNTMSEIGGKDVYRVTYNTELDSILGPIRVYIDAKTMEYLGLDARK